MGIFSIIKALTSGEVKEVEIDFKLDTNDKAGDSDDVYVEDNKLVISREKLDVIIESIKKETVRKVINIETTENNELKITDSKFGGYPYWPAGMEYPVNSHDERLILLAQINLSDVRDPRLPDSGLLQYFISCDDVNGYDDENGFRVIYHKDIDPSATEESVKALGIRAVSDLSSDNDEYMPLYKSYSLTFSEGEEFINERCNTFEKAVADKLRELYNVDMDKVEIKGFYKLYSFMDEKDYDHLSEAFCGGTGHKIFGYPFFTQDDPRCDGENDILLFQMDSEGQDIMWGDSGVGGFFIDEENLKNQNFDKAFFTWDCY
ncbi:YwqG family protein [Butyrivibrio sp. XPD2002]|uniref:YwqG family protein n=1 Tax=Butyrivibrio sp. XPD2002 TaxID=1280665 RepID=UPI00040F8772|nr:YwqG family protein [Butyrivibrio sp. XPD2002]